MAESTVGGVTESDRFILRPGSLNVEEESFVSELQGELVDNLLVLP